MRTLSDPSLYAEKERVYIAVRAKEGRLLSVEQIRSLPAVPAPSGLAREWKMRARSFSRLAGYLSRRFRQREARILDVGCGNGWMSNALATIGNLRVTGIDLNLTELRLAEEAFGGNKRVDFVYGNITEGVLAPDSFDAVVLAASCQYFPDLNGLLDSVIRVNKERGEVHIIDTQFYAEGDLQAARSRSAAYYQTLGFPEMAQYYFHHLARDIERRGATNRNVIASGSRLARRLLRLPPFPWWIMTNETRQQ